MCGPYSETQFKPLMNFIVNNQEHFQTNSAIHNVNTRNKNQLHRPICNLSCFQKSAYYAGIKISTVYDQVSQVLQIKRHNLK
jgi:hypothetical protein